MYILFYSVLRGFAEGAGPPPGHPLTVDQRSRLAEAAVHLHSRFTVKNELDGDLNRSVSRKPTELLEKVSKLSYSQRIFGNMMVLCRVTHI